MNKPERFTSETADIMHALGQNARAAAAELAIASRAQKDTALEAAAEALRQASAAVVEANRLDLSAAREKGLSDAFLDRLELTPKRIDAIASGLQAIAKLDDPVGAVFAQWERPNHLKIERVRTPLGVIGVIFESRPNVTADAGGLCLKAGNAVILRCGSDS